MADGCRLSQTTTGELFSPRPRRSDLLSALLVILSPNRVDLRSHLRSTTKTTATDGDLGELLSTRRGDGNSSGAVPLDYDAIFNRWWKKGKQKCCGVCTHTKTRFGIPCIPVSSNGLSVNQAGDGGNHYGFEKGIRGGRKRIRDDLVEKVKKQQPRETCYSDIMTRKVFGYI
nr:protein ABSCISIC ACID-INSENSITIVE 5 isoform X1 [Ipomoea batatas]